MPDVWALRDDQLAKGCVLVAQGCIPEADAFQRAEAMRLFLMWREAMHSRCRSGEEAEERAGLLAALRKRTVQILVTYCMAGETFIRER
jgi:hypothetical protein